jgi:hypothetical protein
MNIPDKVTTPPVIGGNPFRNLKNVDLTRSDTSQSLFKSTTSEVIVTISGRVVYRPIRK